MRNGLRTKGINSLTIVLALLFILMGTTVLQSVFYSSQSRGVLIPKVEFVGEYKIGDGQWEQYVPGKHIPSTKGDVSIKGVLEMRDPETGDFFEMLPSGASICLNLNHISFTMELPEGGEYIIDIENPYIGEDACGKMWQSFEYYGENGEISATLHNPHFYGNERAVDELLSSIYISSGSHLEDMILSFGHNERLIGTAIVISALLLLGIGLFSGMLKMKLYINTLTGGFLALFAGIYFLFSSPAVSFWSDRVLFNTVTVGSSAMAYMLFAFILIRDLLDEKRKKTATTLLLFYALSLSALILLSVVTDIFFFDIIGPWTAITTVISFAFLVLIGGSFKNADKTKRLFLGFSFTGVACFILDAVAVYFGLWETGKASKLFFVVLFVVAAIGFFSFVPKNINEANKAKALEEEKRILNAELTESRISIMMSQIGPHFIYNTLGSIEQLCELDPPKAAELANNFSKYLRGNFGELDSPRLIRVSKDIEHTKYYVSIEQVRFPDIEVTIEANAPDFGVPALTVQPIVENAIKHGIMKRSRGGRVIVRTYETKESYCISVEDNGVGFDTKTIENKKEHIGLRNIRGRLEAMCSGRLIIESEKDVGTKVVVEIPKEVEK